jgi:hypothetical protein
MTSSGVCSWRRAFRSRNRRSKRRGDRRQLEARFRRLWTGATALQRVASVVSPRRSRLRNNRRPGDRRFATVGWSRLGAAGTFQTVADARAHGRQSCAPSARSTPPERRSSASRSPSTARASRPIGLGTHRRRRERAAAIGVGRVAADGATSAGFYRSQPFGGEPAGAGARRQWRQYGFKCTIFRPTHASASNSFRTHRPRPSRLGRCRAD